MKRVIVRFCSLVIIMFALAGLSGQYMGNLVDMSLDEFRLLPSVQPILLAISIGVPMLFFQQGKMPFSSSWKKSSGAPLKNRLLFFSVLFPFFLTILFLGLTRAELLPPEPGFVCMAGLFVLGNVVWMRLLPHRDLQAVEEEKKKLQETLSLKDLELSAYRKAVDSIFLVSITDEHGTILDTNDNFVTAVGFSRDELIGNTHKLIKSDEHGPEYFRNMWTSIQAGNVWVGEIKNQTKEKRPIWMLTSILPLGKVGRGKPSRYLSIRQDITRIKEAEAFLESENGRLKYAISEIEQLSYIASHDLQQPIRTISNSIETLQELLSDQLDETALMCMEFIDQANTRMGKLVTSMLEYSRLGVQKKLEKFAVNLVVAEVLEDLEALIDDHQARFHIEQLPVISAYRTELRLLLQNLISNAIKFRKEQEPPFISIRADRMEEGWQFEIRDNGIGIGQDQVDKVFEMFRQIHKPGEYEGNGIGLSHCMKIAKMHQGDIWVKSEIGVGSSFFFYLPDTKTSHEKETPLYSYR